MEKRSNFLRQTTATKLVGTTIISVMMIAVALSAVFIILPQDSVVKAATQADWDITNWNTTVGLAHGAVVADSNFVFVADSSYLHQYYRSNGTLKQNMTIPANITVVSDLQTDGNYLYIGGRTSSSNPLGWRVIKYSLPNLVWSAEYYNNTWRYPANILVNDTYVWLSGAMDASLDGSIIKLYKSSMTETGISVEYGQVNDNYIFEMNLDSTEEYMYVAWKVANSMGYIGKFYANNLTYIDSYQLGTTSNYVNKLAMCGDNTIIVQSTSEDGYEHGYWMVSSSLSEQWNDIWTGLPTCGDIEGYNSTSFFGVNRSSSIIERRYGSNGTVNWNYTGFSSNVLMAYCGNYLYAHGNYNDEWILRNISVTSGGGGASVYTIKGLEGADKNVTWTGEAEQTVWSNATTGVGNTMEINMSVNVSDNVTEIRVYCDDLDASIGASNITMYISSDNSSFGSLGTFTDGGSNVSITSITWNVGTMGANPFSGAGLTDKDDSIFCRFTLAIASDVVVNTYSQSDWEVWWKVE